MSVRIHVPVPATEPLPLRDYETKGQLANRIGVSPRTIDNLLRLGLPHIKLTRRLLRFSRTAVDRWLSDRQVQRL